MLSMLPPLAFGQSIAKKFDSPEELASLVGQSRGWEAKYVPIGPAEKFVTRVASLDINGLKLTAISHSPKATDVIAPDSSMMVFTTAGNSYASSINGHLVNFEKGKSAAYVTEGKRVGRGDYRSVLMLDIDKLRLMKTILIMKGETALTANDMKLDIPLELPLQVGNLSLDVGLTHLCGLLDLYISSYDALEALALDESFYRLIAMMFQPKWLYGSETRADRRSVNPRRLDAACQFARANLDKPITLTDLERISNLSARSLQYAFRKEFGCTPMQWLRSQRMHLARHHLLNATPFDTITSIAISCGLMNLSHFSVDYRRLFGESPSETLARRFRR